MSVGNCKLKQRDTTAHLFKWPKSKTLTKPNAGEDVELQELSSSLEGMQNSAAALEDSSVVSHKTEHALTILSSNYAPR